MVTKLPYYICVCSSFNLSPCLTTTIKQKQNNMAHVGLSCRTLMSRPKKIDSLVFSLAYLFKEYKATCCGK
jgi:hypothetical protein